MRSGPYLKELVVAHAAENMMQHQPVDDDKRFSQDIWTDMDVQEKAARTAVLHRYLKDPEFRFFYDAAAAADDDDAEGTNYMLGYHSVVDPAYIHALLSDEFFVKESRGLRKRLKKYRDNPAELALALSKYKETFLLREKGKVCEAVLSVS